MFAAFVIVGTLGGWFVMQIIGIQPNVVLESGRPAGQVPDLTLKTEDLDVFAGHPILGPLAAKVKKHLGEYDSTRTETIRHSDPPLRIDVLLQYHEYLRVGPDGNPMEMDLGEKEKVKRCQAKVHQVLEALHPDMVGWEGSDVPNVTFENLARQTYQQAREQGQSVSFIAIRMALEVGVEYDGTLQYLKAHPDARVYGYEDRALNEFQDTLLGLLESPFGDQSWGHINQRLGPTRGTVNLCRFINQMRVEKLRHGAFVIGYMHEPEILQSLKALGTETRIYNLTH
ncbi:MAG: hypothetical protein HYY50_03285 [Candidatus Kerfeldbacteria bacterium]|nr:hypothetical protein [Candidatus Kerfeldbacteria bacterium]